MDGLIVGLGGCGIISLLIGIGSRTVQTVANRYTNCAILASLAVKVGRKIRLRCLFLCTLFVACGRNSSQLVVLLSQHLHTVCAVSEALIISWDEIFRSLLKSGSFVTSHRVSLIVK
jgi:hypothetical protein